MTNQEALNFVLPDRHMLEGGVGLGDYLARMADWIERITLKVADKEALESELQVNPDRTKMHVPMKTIRPGMAVAAALREFLETAYPDAITPSHRMKFGPDWVSSVIRSDEATIQIRNLACIIPKAFPKQESKSNDLEPWMQQPPPEVEGFGSASKARQV